MSAYLDKFVSRKEKSFIQPVIDWEAGLFGRLTATLHQSHNDGGQFILHFEKFITLRAALSAREFPILDFL